MRKIFPTALLLAAFACAYADNTTGTQNVINPFSDEYKSGLKTEVSSGMLGDTSSRKVKYISTLSRDTARPPAGEAVNSTASSQPIPAASDEKPSGTAIAANTTLAGAADGLKILKSR